MSDRQPLTDAERDALFGKVFATPAGKELLADWRVYRSHFLTLAEVELRLGRQAKHWATGPHRAAAET
jgi:hypothetical protein